MKHSFKKLMICGMISQLEEKVKKLKN